MHIHHPTLLTHADIILYPLPLLARPRFGVTRNCSPRLLPLPNGIVLLHRIPFQLDLFPYFIALFLSLASSYRYGLPQ